MTSNTSLICTCLVSGCGKEFCVKRLSQAIKAHIEWVAASELKDLTSIESHSHHQYLQNHTLSESEKHKVLLEKNSQWVKKWRATHPEKYKEYNSCHHQAQMDQKCARKIQLKSPNTLVVAPPAPPAALAPPAPLSDNHLLTNPYYLLSLLGITIQQAAFTAEEVRDSLQRIERVLGQTGSKVLLYYPTYIYIC